MAFWISRPLYLSISTNPVHQDPQLCCSNSPLQGAYKVTEEEPVIHLKYAAGILVASAAFKTIYYRPISMRKRHFEKSCKQKVAAVEKWPRLQQANKSHQCGIRAKTLPWQQMYPTAEPSGLSVAKPTDTPGSSAAHTGAVPGEAVIFLHGSLTPTLASRETRSFHPAFEKQHGIPMP